MFHRAWSELRYRLRALLHRRQFDRDMDSEMRAHLDLEEEKHLRAGLSPEDARRRARAAFGSLSATRDDARDARGFVFFDTMLQDLRYALRGLRRSKVFAFGVILTLALGIGANATMFGLVDRMLFRAPPGLIDPDRVHRLYVHRLDDGELRVDRNFSVPTWQDLLRETRSFDRIAAFQTRRFAIGEGDDVRELPVTIASASYFEFFDARPVRGRFYGAREDSLPAGEPVVVLGYAYWMAAFGGRDVTGQSLRIDRTVRTIIGVAPPGFVGMADQGAPVAYIPLSSHAYASRGSTYMGRYTWSWLEMVARRKAGVELAAAETDLTTTWWTTWRRMEAADRGWGSPESVKLRAELGPIHVGRGPQAGPESKVAAWVSGVAAIVLIIACANVANLLLARAVSRRREIALRLAIGVGRGRLVRQLVTESLVLAFLGGIAGLAMAQGGAGVLRRFFLPDDVGVPVLTDTRSLLFTLGTIAVAALLCGLVPALHAARGRAGEALAGRGVVGDSRGRLRPFLLVLQCALSMVLLVGAGLFVRSLGHVEDFRLGYDVESVVYAQVNGRGYRPTPAEQVSLNQRMQDAARSLPGVTHVALAATVPFWSNEGRGLWVPGVDSVSMRGRFMLQAATDEYFATMGTRIVRGRAFDTRDREGTPRVIVVSEGMARVLWPGREAIGECVRISEPDAPCNTVIGVAEEARLRQLNDAREYSYYIPAWQYDNPMEPQLLVRVSGGAGPMVETVRRRLQQEMPGSAYVQAMPLSDLVDPSLRSWRMGATLFVAFGGLALVLAAIGLYSMIAYDVAQRSRDLGVRLALGARESGILGLVVMRGLRLVVVGLVIGGVIAFMLAPKIEPLMFSQSARDPVVLGVVAALLVVVGVVATLVPGVRASRVDPAVTLRSD
jgi:putative ABC transport system permease protein